MEQQRMSQWNPGTGREQNAERPLVPYPDTARRRPELDANLIRESLALLPIVTVEEIL